MASTEEPQPDLDPRVFLKVLGTLAMLTGILTTGVGCVGLQAVPADHPESILDWLPLFYWGSAIGMVGAVVVVATGARRGWRPRG
jgi:hypothetical protein